MKEHPLLFSGPMVRAILEGRKTQTRRIVKQKAWPLLDKIREHNGKPVWQCLDFDVKCPYGTVGDRIWVRETFSIEKEPGLDKCGIGKWVADKEEFEIDYSEFDSEFGPARLKYGKTYPSIFMPRWASRITLEITDIRIRRLQEITEGDAIAEGFWCKHDDDGCDGECHKCNATAKEAFTWSWDKIYSNWLDNPWVWALTFKRIA